MLTAAGEEQLQLEEHHQVHPMLDAHSFIDTSQKIKWYLSNLYIIYGYEVTLLLAVCTASDCCQQIFFSALLCSIAVRNNILGLMYLCVLGVRMQVKAKTMLRGELTTALSVTSCC